MKYEGPNDYSMQVYMLYNVMSSGWQIAWTNLPDNCNCQKFSTKKLIHARVPELREGAEERREKEGGGGDECTAHTME